MSLVFAAITPHPPTLIPTIGKEHLQQLNQTKQAFEELERELYSSKPDVIFIISPHGELFQNFFTVNLCDKFEGNFEIFGDFSTQLNFKGDTVLFSANKEVIATKSPLNIISQPLLDHGVTIPLYYLTRHLTETPIVPIYFSMLDNQAHHEFGKALKDVILNTEKRVAVIASGDLSHCLSNNSPAPYHPDGKIFDEKLANLVATNNHTELINIDQRLVDNAMECGLKSILILAGILSDMSCRPKILSYEAPFGVGYLTVFIDVN